MVKDIMVPKISVLMAVNKEDKFLDSAINSILNQTFSQFEFIIVVNAASDILMKRFERYKELDPRIIIYRTPIPGLANALNCGLAISRADIIARMDSDDLSCSNRLLLQYNYMIENPDIVILGCKVKLINFENKIVGEFKFFPDNKSIRTVLPYRNPFVHPSIMMRKNPILMIGGYKYGHMSEDHELFIRLARDSINIFSNLNEYLFKYRRHSDQITSMKNANKNYAEIAGFLFTEFLLTKQIKYLIGILVVHPTLRRIRNFIKAKF